MLTKDQIIEGLSHLSQQDRDAVLDLLIQRIDEADEMHDSRRRPKADAQWSAELDRRIDALDRGETTAASWSDVEARLERLLEEMGEPGPPQQ